ncbi:histidine kinase [Winogradskyella litorisediminis]|uniref:Histidine kinase n=1 Tax=Winogradskyella litorisediminis TaxID=1156618 RepID=A0ABW3NCD9_9FLAO
MLRSYKQIGVVFLIGCGVLVISNIVSGTLFNYKSTTHLYEDVGFTMLYTFVLSYINTLFFDYVKSLNFSSFDVAKRIFVGILGSTILTLSAIFLLRLIISTLYNGISINRFLEQDSWEGYQFGLWITLTILSVFYVIYFYNRFQKTKIKEQKVIAGTASARFDALKNQLDPHFLFNSLNVLTSLIEENPQSAQKFTTSLSKVYRYVLEQKNKDLITVDEELKFAKTYMSLLKMRFEDSIVFEIPEKASNPESRVVPLSLQLLLENAVKHNTVTTSNPLHIKIYEDGGYLVVLNNLQPKQIVKKSSGVGLENIKQRYKLLSDKKVIINQRAKDFAVAIPMLTKQVSIMRQSHLPQNKLDESYVKARKRLDELKGFYGSLASYCLIIPFLVFIWYRYTSDTIQWFWFPIIGWGLSLCFQAYRVFYHDSAFGSQWEERKIQEFMRKEEENNRWN